MKKGRLIALYGINNLGKTTQAKLLVSSIEERGLKTRYLKYPLYDLEPSGPLINNYLREGNQYGLSAREFQIIQILNRTQFDSQLRAILDSGENVVVEDYVGTGIAWGMGAGIPKDFLMDLNTHLVKEDLAILLEGERFLDGKEDGHKHEEDDKLMQEVGEAHLTLAEEYGWKKVNANQSVEDVKADILKYTDKIF